MAVARIQVSGEPSYLGFRADAGVHVFLHVRVKPSGALDVIQVFSGESGKVSVNRVETSRKKLREDVEGIFRETGVRLGSAPADYVAWRVHEQVDACLAMGAFLTPSDLAAVRSIARPTEAPAHPALQLLPIEHAEERVAESVGLHTQPELRAWMPDEAVLAAIAERVLQTRETPASEPLIVIPGEIRPEANRDGAVRDAMNDAIDAYFGDAQRRQSTATTLLDLALTFASTRRHEEALDAVATAEAVLHAPKPHAVPFVYGLIYKYVLVQRALKQRNAASAPE